MKVIKGLALLCLLMLTGCQSEEETRQFLLACKYDAPATIEAMLNNGIDVDGQDKTGLSGLWRSRVRWTRLSAQRRRNRWRRAAAR